MHHVRHVYQSFLPSFLQSSRNKPTKPTPRIAVLDRIRGLLSLIVFNSHLTSNLTSDAAYAYGSDNIFSWTQLPFLRLFFLGTSCVCVFFVISGYVLAYAPLEQAFVKRNGAAALHAIASRIVKRPFRLFVPVFTSIILCAFASYCGLFEKSRKYHGVDNQVYWLSETPPPRYQGLAAQMWHALSICFGLVKFGKWADNDPVPMSGSVYNDHVWTVPLEHQSSMLLFLAAACASQMKVGHAQVLLAMLSIYAFCCDRWEIICFLAGASMALYDVTPQEPRKRSASTYQGTDTAWKLITLFMGLFLLSVPLHECTQDPIYAYLNSPFRSKTYDEGAHLRTGGAILVVRVVISSPDTQLGFAKDILSYLGRISHSFYLVHGPIIRCILHAIIPTLYKLTGDGTYDGQDAMGNVICWFVGWAVCFPPTLWAADLFWRVIDRSSMRLADWIERRVFRGNEGSHKRAA